MSPTQAELVYGTDKLLVRLLRVHALWWADDLCRNKDVLPVDT